jgi:hypothetical protein
MDSVRGEFLLARRNLLIVVAVIPALAIDVLGQPAAAAMTGAPDSREAARTLRLEPPPRLECRASTARTNQISAIIAQT